jgi:hypothetical protein
MVQKSSSWEEVRGWLGVSSPKKMIFEVQLLRMS